MSSDPTSADTRLLLNAYADGELDAATALDVERKINADTGLASELRTIQQLQSVLRQKLPAESASPELRRKILSAVGAQRRRSYQPTWRTLAASIAVATILSSATTWVVMDGRSTDDMLESVVDSHVRSLVAPNPVDVPSSERHIVKPWFNGKLTSAPKVADLSAAGYPLAGARIDVIQGTAIPTLVYNRRLHVISLMAIPAGGRLIEPAHLQSIKGYNVVTWHDGDTIYWGVSDLNRTELDEFAKLFRTAP